LTAAIELACEDFFFLAREQFFFLNDRSELGRFSPLQPLDGTSPADATSEATRVRSGDRA
jgi:hypothetical protein